MLKRSFFLLLIPVIAAEVAALAFAYLRMSHKVAGAYGFPLDDSWIHAVFARNLAEGRGMVYNPGQHVSSTSILYTLLLGALYRIRVAPVFNATAFGLLLHLAAAVMVYLIALRLSFGKSAAAAAAVLFAAIPRLIWGALSGTEVSLYVFLVVLGIFWHIRYRWHEGAKGYLATLAFGLSALARPECGAFLVVSIIDRLITSAKFDREQGGALKYLATVPLHLALFAIVILPWIVFNLKHTGLPLPPAFYAKTAVSLHSANLFGVLAVGVKQIPIFIFQAVLVSWMDSKVMLIGLVAGFFTSVLRSDKRAGAGILILPLGFLLLPAVTSVLAGVPSAGFQLLFQNGRYSCYLVPILALLGVLGALSVDDIGVRLLGRCGYRGGAALAVFFAAALVFLPAANRRQAREYSISVQNINDMEVALGKWAAAHTPPGALIGVYDAGAIPYFSRRPILDVVGVVNPEVVARKKAGGYGFLWMIEYLKERRPAYLMIFPDWYPGMLERADFLEPVHSVEIEQNVVCGGDRMIVYRTKWR